MPSRQEFFSGGNVVRLAIAGLVVAGAMAIASACSEKKNEKPPAAAPTAAVAPAAGKAVMSAEIPRDISGLPFAVGGKCAIDSVNKPQQSEVMRINRADGMKVEGWAFDDQKQGVPRILVLQLASGDTKFHAQLARHGGREDLVKAFGKPDYSEAGYSADIEIRALPSTQYEVLVIQKTLTRNLVCPTYRKLVIDD